MTPLTPRLLGPTRLLNRGSDRDPPGYYDPPPPAYSAPQSTTENVLSCKKEGL